MPTDLPVLALIAVVAAAVALSVFRRTEPAGDAERRSHAHRPGLLAAATDIVDASVGMLMFRRTLGLPTTTRAERARAALAAALAPADEPGRRASLAGPAVVAPTRLIVAGTAASHTERDLPDRQAHPVAGETAAGPVWRSPVSLSRLGVVAGGGLVALLVGGFVLWPRPGGAVLSATGTPGPSPTADVSSSSSASESPTPAVTQTSAAGTPEATPAQPTTTGATPTPTPIGVPTATRTPRPAARATNSPRPTLHPTPIPTPTASPTSTATADPTPTPTAEPTPTPTAKPTPQPTPDPTPVPTPDPTPDPAPTPTP